MLKKVLLLSLVLSSFLFGMSQSQAIQAVKSNPALLNTPQAQAEMAKRGVSKSQVMQKFNSSKITTTNKESTNEAINTIETVESKNKEVKVEKASSKIYANPLFYKGNADRLKDIKSKQNNINTSKLSRFSKAFFTNKNKLNSKSLPVPNYYVVSSNDVISIWLYGGVNKNIEVVVDNNGNINIETLGPIKVAGLEFQKVEEILKSQLSNAFGGAKVAINILNYSTIQVTLTGDVNGAGVYSISSLSTIKDLLIVAGGVKQNGSVREIIIKRNGDILKSIDFYKLLLGNDDGIKTLLRSGDIIFVPKASKIVAIDGGVQNPAFYELKSDENLDSLISYAGGLKANASKSGIKIVGFDANEKRIVSTVNFKDVKSKKLNNSDKVYIYNIDAVHKDSIYLYGNVVRPGSRNVEKSLSSLLQNEINTFGLKGVFLENTLFTYAMIKSKNSDLTTSISRFNLAQVIAGEKDISLKIDDEIYIFNKLDSELNPYVTIKGSVVAKKGEYQYFDGLNVYDLIKIAGIKSPYDTKKIKVVTFNTDNLLPKTVLLNLEESKKYILSAYDQVELYDYYDVHKIPTVKIHGEINIPGEYDIHTGMSLKNIINIAGGLTVKAFRQQCEIVRYHIVNGQRKKDIINIPLSKATKFKLKDFDEITIRTIPNWSERKTVTLKGEVKFPGTYVIEHGDKLADVISRAGGFSKEAFLYGAVFTRKSIQQLQQEKLQESLIKLQQKAATMEGMEETGAKKDQELSKTVQAVNELVKKSEELKPMGRISVKLSDDLEVFKLSSSNLILKDKDTLYIPSFNDIVLVMGQVMNPTAIIYDDDDVSNYIERAGGLTQFADSDNIYVIHANGEAHKYSTGIFLSDSVEVKTGDVIVVPQELVTTTGMQFAKDVSAIMYQFAVTAASLKTVGAF